MKLHLTTSYPHDLVQNVAVWALRESFTDEELELLDDNVMTIANRPTSFSFAGDKGGWAYNDKTAIVYLHDGFEKAADGSGLLHRDFAEQTIDGVVHEARHLVQYARARQKAAMSPIPITTETHVESVVDDDDAERRAAEERLVDQIVQKRLAEDDPDNDPDEREATAAGLRVLIIWREELVPFQRDQIMFGRLKPPPYRWG